MVKVFNHSIKKELIKGNLVMVLDMEKDYMLINKVVYIMERGNLV